MISGWSEFAQSGGLMTYGPNSSKFFRRLAVYVQKIVAGAKPGGNSDRAANNVQARRPTPIYINRLVSPCLRRLLPVPMR